MGVLRVLWSYAIRLAKVRTEQCGTIRKCGTLVAHIHYQAHCRTLPHCRKAAHCRARCHILPSALPYTITRNARTLPRNLPHTTRRTATHSNTLPHTAARTAAHSALPHTAVHYRTAEQPHTITRIAIYTTKRTAAHCCGAHCHTMPLVPPHIAALPESCTIHT
jgi:hypothetical protein